MNRCLSKLGFTLMEVNLAIFIMAAGVMAMVSLYPLGFRENEQSQTDVIGAAAADAVLNQLTAALSSRNTTWSEWHSAVNGAVNAVPNGWMSYCEKHGNAYTPMKKGAIESKAKQVFDALARAYKDGGGTPKWDLNDDYVYALVAQWGFHDEYEDRSRVALSFRCAKKPGALFASPIYYTEIHFQGDQKGLE